MSKEFRNHIARTRPLIFALTIGAGLYALGAWTSHAQSPNIVSQKGRLFQPAQMTVKAGDAVLIVNDDADLRHHAYIDSDALKFDSGDQEPGSRTTVKFPVAGTFDVLCAIHPKMKLTVHVK